MVIMVLDPSTHRFRGDVITKIENVDDDTITVFSSLKRLYENRFSSTDEGFRRRSVYPKVHVHSSGIYHGRRRNLVVGSEFSTFMTREDFFS